jgi:hypothetical protein
MHGLSATRIGREDPEIIENLTTNAAFKQEAQG